MSSPSRPDDFEARRQHLRGLTDEQLHARFWALADQVVAPLVEEARTHTTPAIERSVLLRMGVSSIEAKALVDRLAAEDLLGHGAGRLVLRVALVHQVTPRAAAQALLRDDWWDDVRAAAGQEVTA